MGRTAGEAVRISEVDPPAGAGRERRQGRDHLPRELVHPAAAPAQRAAHPLSGFQSRVAIPVSRVVRRRRDAVFGCRGTLSDSEGYRSWLRSKISMLLWSVRDLPASISLTVCAAWACPSKCLRPGMLRAVSGIGTVIRGLASTL